MIFIVLQNKQVRSQLSDHINQLFVSGRSMKTPEQCARNNGSKIRLWVQYNHHSVHAVHLSHNISCDMKLVTIQQSLEICVLKYVLFQLRLSLSGMPYVRFRVKVTIREKKAGLRLGTRKRSYD